MIKEYILVASDISLEHNDTMLVEKMKSGALNEFEKVFFLARVRQSRYCVITLYDHIPANLERKYRLFLGTWLIILLLIATSIFFLKRNAGFDPSYIYMRVMRGTSITKSMTSI